MAASLSSTSYSLLSQGNNYKNDPSLFSSCNSNKGFHFPSYAALNLKPTTNTVIIKSAAGNDNNGNGNSSSCCSGNNNSKSLNKARQPRAFAPSLPQLIGRDSDKTYGLVEETNTCHDRNWFNNSGAYHTIGLSGEPLPEKLVVAVDVDEDAACTLIASLALGGSLQLLRDSPLPAQMSTRPADCCRHETPSVEMVEFVSCVKTVPKKLPYSP